MPRFYVLRPWSDKDSAFVTAEAPEVRKSCAVYVSLAVTRSGPLSIDALPSTGADIVWSWLSDVLVNARTKECFERSHIKGCEFEPVTIKGPASKDVSPLWELRVAGFGGFVNPRSDPEVERSCDECSAYSFRIPGSFANLVDREKWDGSDVFTIWPFPRRIICTGRVVKALADCELRGAVAIPIEEFGEIEDIPISPGLPAVALSESAVAKLMHDEDFIETIMNARTSLS